MLCDGDLSAVCRYSEIMLCMYTSHGLMCVRYRSVEDEGPAVAKKEESLESKL